MGSERRDHPVRQHDDGPGAGIGLLSRRIERHYRAFTSDVWTDRPIRQWTTDWLGISATATHAGARARPYARPVAPGAYNYDPNLDLTYGNYAEYAQDSGQYSIMSYWYPMRDRRQRARLVTLQFANAQTPMLHDILTIQSKYGADPTTRPATRSTGSIRPRATRSTTSISIPSRCCRSTTPAGTTRSTFPASTLRSS